MVRSQNPDICSWSSNSLPWLKVNCSTCGDLGKGFLNVRMTSYPSCDLGRGRLAKGFLWPFPTLSTHVTADVNLTTGWPVRLITSFCCHQIESWVLILRVDTETELALFGCQQKLVIKMTGNPVNLFLVCVTLNWSVHKLDQMLLTSALKMTMIKINAEEVNTCKCKNYFCTQKVYTI